MASDKELDAILATYTAMLWHYTTFVTQGEYKLADQARADLHTLLDSLLDSFSAVIVGKSINLGDVN